MKMKKNLLILAVIMGLSSISFSVLDDQPKKPWVVPDKFIKMKNPVTADAESIKTGKSLYAMHCKSCHGSKGLGDGTKAAKLKTEPGNFSTADFQSQSDGALFYKTTEGRDDMPSFDKKIHDDDDRWSIVNYIRTLKK